MTLLHYSDQNNTAVFSQPATLATDINPLMHQIKTIIQPETLGHGAMHQSHLGQLDDVLTEENEPSDSSDSTELICHSIESTDVPFDFCLPHGEGS
jgi:hypothetical protein